MKVPARGGREKRIAAAKAHLRGLRSLKRVDEGDLRRLFGIGYPVSETLINAEKLARGMIASTDLTPPQRRALVDPENLDLHALAAGPIMQPETLYLPAGKISLAEARAREAAAVEVINPHPNREQGR
jgi:hypothetical protein